MFEEVAKKEFANGVVYALRTYDGYLIEVTDTFLPSYTKYAIGEHQNSLHSDDLGSRSERWMIGVSTMSGCPVRCKFCLVPGSKIAMSDFTDKCVEDIQVGDSVISNILTQASNENKSYSSKYCRENKVTEIFKREYDGEIIKITLENGCVVQLTPNHRVAKVDVDKYRNSYTKAEDLRVGDSVFSLGSGQFGQSEQSDSWIVGWLCGFIKGDSVYTKNVNRPSYKTTVSQSNGLIYVAHEWANKYFGKTSQVWDYYDDNENHSVSHLFSFGEETHNNMLSVISEHSHTNDFKLGFLAGFWDAEGFSFKNNNTVRVCNNTVSNLEMFNRCMIETGLGVGRLKLYKSAGKCYILESNVSRFEFNRVVCPLHTKKQYLQVVGKIKNVCGAFKIVSIDRRTYKGFVYNFATEEHTYIADGVLVHNCATGSMKKCRVLTTEEIVGQVDFITSKHTEKFVEAFEHKVNYTRMGEPFLNVKNVKRAVEIIECSYPNTHHYISTIGVQGADYSWIKDNITLQVSVHSLDDNRRNWLIPYKKKVTIKELGEIETKSTQKTTVNMTLVDENDFNISDLCTIFNKDKFFIKLSPINTNCVSDSNALGNGIIKSVNII